MFGSRRLQLFIFVGIALLGQLSGLFHAYGDEATHTCIVWLTINFGTLYMLLYNVIIIICGSRSSSSSYQHLGHSVSVWEPCCEVQGVCGRHGHQVKLLRRIRCKNMFIVVGRYAS